MRRNHPLLSLSVLALLLLAVYPAGAENPAQPAARVSIELTGVAAGVGVSWGSGVLSYAGKTYPFRVEGLSVGDVGIARVSATGKVYNLKRVSDFPGTYAAVGAGVSVAGGVAGLTMQNQRGVVIDLTATQEGVKFNIGPQGLTITMR